MTLPSPVGYPDFGRFASRATKIYINDTLSVPTGLTEFLLTFVGDVPYLNLVASPASRNTEFTFTFLGSSNVTDVIYHQVLVIPGAGTGALTIPVGGPFVRVRARANTATDDVFTTLSGIWTPTQINYNTALDSVLISTTQNIAAGANATVAAIRMWAGEASYALWGDSGNCRFILRALGLTGATTEIHRDSTVGGNTGRCPGTVYLPAAPVEVLLVNNHGAAQNVRFFLSARPIGPGW